MQSSGQLLSDIHSIYNQLFAGEVLQLELVSLASLACLRASLGRYKKAQDDEMRGLVNTEEFEETHLSVRKIGKTKGWPQVYELKFAAKTRLAGYKLVAIKSAELEPELGVIENVSSDED